MLPLDLLHILACPTCCGELVQAEPDSPLYCKPCRREFPVVDGIPILFLDQKDSARRTEREAQ